MNTTSIDALSSAPRAAGSLVILNDSRSPRLRRNEKLNVAGIGVGGRAAATSAPPGARTSSPVRRRRRPCRRRLQAVPGRQAIPDFRKMFDEMHAKMMQSR